MKRVSLIVFAWGLVFSYAMAQDEPAVGGSLVGVVETQQGKPVADVKVSLINRLSNKRVAVVTTDNKGKFQLRHLTEGRYTLIFFSPSFQPAVIRSVRVKRGRVKRLKHPIRLKPIKQEAIINGAVFSHEGTLVPGARVVLERIPFHDEAVPHFKRVTLTNHSGEFAFRLPAAPARYRLTASARGFRPQSKTLDVEGAARRHVSIQLEPKP